MNTLLQYLAQIRGLLKSSLQQFEESQTFERWVMRFDSLDPLRQKQIKEVTLVTLLVSVVLSFIVPIGAVLSLRSEVASIRELTLSARRVQTDYGIERRAAPKPMGWQALSASNADELENSINTFLNSINLNSDEYSIVRQGVENFRLEVPELNLRQLQLLVHQLDGWHPSVRLTQTRSETVGDSKEKLKVTLSFRYDPKSPFSGGSSIGFRNGSDSAEEELGTESFPPSSGSSFDSSRSGSARSSGNDSAGNPLGVDIDENEADIPPPPPPPGISPDAMTFDDDEG
jgi:hypothetical protein